MARDPRNYDAWFDYLKLEESVSGADAVRAVYARAVQHVPPVAVKMHWCRYIYLWINWAIYEELHAGVLLPRSALGCLCTWWAWCCDPGR